MSVVCPTVTASSVNEYNDLIAVASFANYIHIDLADGVYAKASVDLKDIWLPVDTQADIHLMYKKPFDALPTLIALQPSMVIVHAEAEGDMESFSSHLKEHGIRFGVALVQALKVDDYRSIIQQADHALIFSGHLGSFGGKVDLSLLQKVSQLKALNSSIEIGWDGGINLENINALAQGGIEVLNVGGSIQKALYPENAYRELVRKLGA